MCQLPESSMSEVVVPRGITGTDQSTRMMQGYNRNQYVSESPR